MVCPVCDGSGFLLSQTCPLCEDDAEAVMDDRHVTRTNATAEFWCDICHKDLQSMRCFEQHCAGRRHLSHVDKTAMRPQLLQLDENKFFDTLAAGRYQHIVVCTGAGVSTAAGIPDFRSAGGFFDALHAAVGWRFPNLTDPESLLSRSFCQAHPEVWKQDVLPLMTRWSVNSVMPTATHRFCSWLFRRGWLKRIYTQNVDGLHTHSSLDITRDVVVECHGSLRDQTLVLYGDPLPRRFLACCDTDLDQHTSDVDLMLVMGTSLQVAPFCAIPNMAPRGCTRVLVNENLMDCRTNSWSKRSRLATDLGGCAGLPTAQIGRRKEVRLRPLWWDRKSQKRWSQLIVESRCDEFVDRFFTRLGGAPDI